MPSEKKMMVASEKADKGICLSLYGNDDILEVLTQLFLCGLWMEVQNFDV